MGHGVLRLCPRASLLRRKHLQPSRRSRHHKDDQIHRAYRHQRLRIQPKRYDDSTFLRKYCWYIVQLHSAMYYFPNIQSKSKAWDTISEVTALAMQSQPTQVLRYTCAGIATTTIFTHIVKIARLEKWRALELDFGDIKDADGVGVTGHPLYG